MAQLRVIINKKDDRLPKMNKPVGGAGPRYTRHPNPYRYRKAPWQAKEYGNRKHLPTPMTFGRGVADYIGNWFAPIGKELTQWEKPERMAPQDQHDREIAARPGFHGVVTTKGKPQPNIDPNGWMPANETMVNAGWVQRARDALAKEEADALAKEEADAKMKKCKGLGTAEAAQKRKRERGCHAGADPRNQCVGYMERVRDYDAKMKKEGTWTAFQAWVQRPRDAPIKEEVDAKTKKKNENDTDAASSTVGGGKLGADPRTWGPSAWEDPRYPELLREYDAKKEKEDVEDARDTDLPPSTGGDKTEQSQYTFGKNHDIPYEPPSDEDETDDDEPDEDEPDEDEMCLGGLGLVDASDEYDRSEYEKLMGYPNKTNPKTPRSNASPNGPLRGVGKGVKTEAEWAEYYQKERKKHDEQTKKIDDTTLGNFNNDEAPPKQNCFGGSAFISQGSSNSTVASTTEVPLSGVGYRSRKAYSKKARDRDAKGSGRYWDDDTNIQPLPGRREIELRNPEQKEKPVVAPPEFQPPPSDNTYGSQAMGKVFPTHQTSKEMLAYHNQQYYKKVKDPKRRPESSKAIPAVPPLIAPRYEDADTPPDTPRVTKKSKKNPRKKTIASPRKIKRITKKLPLKKL